MQRAKTALLWTLTCAVVGLAIGCVGDHILDPAEEGCVTLVSSKDFSMKTGEIVQLSAHVSPKPGCPLLRQRFVFTAKYGDTVVDLRLPGDTTVLVTASRIGWAAVEARPVHDTGVSPGIVQITVTQ